MYIADTYNNRVRKVTVSTGIITTIAGSSTSGGYSGDNGPATSAALNIPFGVSLDATGNLYIVDTVNNRVRKVTVSSGVISTLAGNGARGYSGDGGAATSAALYFPQGVALDSSGTQTNILTYIFISNGYFCTLQATCTSQIHPIAASAR